MLMMEGESLQERQDNEFEALKAIFGDDIEDNKKVTAWQVWKPLDLLLTLHPLHSSTADGVHCSVTLHIECCANYPDRAPTITIFKKHGLSNDNTVQLLEELSNLASQLCGEVMIFNLAQHVQSFLHAHNRPTLSFYDEMLERQNQLEQRKQRDLKVKEDIERQKIKDEIQRQQELQKNEGRQRSRLRSSSQDVDNDICKDKEELVYFEDNKEAHAKMENVEQSIDLPCTCTSKTMFSLRISQRNNKKIHVGNCLGHSTNGSTTSAAMDADTGDILIAKKWSFNPASDLQTRKRQLGLIQNDFKITCKINHSVLLPYNSMELTSEVKDQRTTQCIYLFRDFVNGCSLTYRRPCLCEKDVFEVLKLVRHVANGVFSALSELHSVDICHSDVRAENVFLGVSGAVKLVGASLDVRLREIVQGRNFNHRQTKAYDVYCTAQLLLSLLCKNRTGQEIPSHLPSVVKDFFSRCLIEDDNFQWTADQLLKHGFLRDAPAQVSENKEKDDGYNGSEDESRKLAKQYGEHTFGYNLTGNGHSRLSDEFEVINILGKGAFGEVIKVRNKLDGGFYAIKHIKLNPENEKLNRKITREVKLLSRLNHENVVRYYNAWIETVQGVSSDDCNEKTDTDLDKVFTRSPLKKSRVIANSIEGIAAKLAPGVKLEWSISGTPVQKCGAISESSDSEDDDGWTNPTTADDSSSSIEFEVDTNNQSVTLPSEPMEISTPPTMQIYKALYIQMEFCEKNTLRHAIDNSLYLEHVRAWRLLREIVEGLAHVHQRGMIHRDLKPVNIFLDSNDHVKIGDFGLATTAFTGLPRPVDDKNKTQEDFGGSLTGQVGTALYVAPELLQGANKVIYNQKVDLYSLGIILFEMFHPPLDTAMERIMVLKELRQKEIKLPETFNNEQNSKQINVIRWLLNHDPSKRPTCAELLSGPHIPRSLAEGALVGLISHTLTSKGTKNYQRLIEACMGQQSTQTEDYIYNSAMKLQDPMIGCIKECIVRVFKRHGAVELTPPLLQPRARVWEHSTNAVKLMTGFGSVVHLPHDLRLPFARFTAHSDIKYIRRYVIDRVFREKSTNSHPREILECAFDIVIPKTTLLWSDAELLVVANSVATQMGLNVSFQINHTNILKIVLLSCGIDADKHIDFYPVLVDVGTGRINKIQLQTHLTSLCLTPRDTANLLQLLESDVPAHEAKGLITPIVKRNELNDQFCRAVNELETVTRNAKSLGMDNPITFMPCLAYNATQHGGIFWQLVCSKDQKKGNQSRHRSADLIAVGGRYNTLVEEFWQVAKSGKDDQDLKTTSVGFSMSLERMAAILKKKDVDVRALMLKSFEAEKAERSMSQMKVCVCIWGTAGNGRKSDTAVRRAKITRELWQSQITTCTADCRTTSEAHDLTAAPIVVLLEDNAATVSVSCWDEDANVREHRVTDSMVVELVKQKIHSESFTKEANEGTTCTRSASWCENERMNNSLVSVVIIADASLTSKVARRRYESQAMNAVTSCMNGAGVCRRTCALAMWCSGECVRALVGQLDPPLQEGGDVTRAFRHVQERFPQHNKILVETMGELTKMASSKASDETPLFALYSILDGVCKLII